MKEGAGCGLCCTGNGGYLNGCWVFESDSHIVYYGALVLSSCAGSGVFISRVCALPEQCWHHLSLPSTNVISVSFLRSVCESTFYN